MKEYKKSLKKFSRDLRNNLTDAEQLLWFHLRRKQILNVQFIGKNQLLVILSIFIVLLLIWLLNWMVHSMQKLISKEMMK